MSNPKAFPTYEWVQSHGQMMAVGGMDLRDYFAAQVIGGYVAGMKPNPTAQEGVCSNGFANNNAEALAKASYILADAMMKAREVCSDTK